MPVGGHDPQVKTASFAFTGGSTIVDQNANELWTVLVCKPWLDGEFGTTVYTTAKGAKPTVVNQYGRQLLWAQAIAANENPTPALITAKENTYAGIAASIKQNDPAVYSLFQGNQYPTRLEIAFAALFAALVAGVLVLLIAITLIILKLGFLLLLVAGPFFLIVGTHPGFGRVVALRWFEMLVGVLLKQAAIALVLSVLLYAYSLIMGTSDATLPWALKILMIALVTVAVFIYRKPFVHLFSAVGYGMVGSRTPAIPSLSGRAARRGGTRWRPPRWACRASPPTGPRAGPGGTLPRRPGRSRGQRGGRGAAGATAASAAASGAGAASAEAAGAEQAGAAADASSDDAYQNAAGRSGLAARGRGRATEGADGSARSAPPLDLPDRDGTSQRPASGWSRTSASDTAAGRARRVRQRPAARRPGRWAGPAAPAASPPAAAPRPGSARQRWPGRATAAQAAAPPQSAPAPPQSAPAAPRPSGSAAPSPFRRAAPALVRRRAVPQPKSRPGRQARPRRRFAQSRSGPAPRTPSPVRGADAGAAASPPRGPGPALGRRAARRPGCPRARPGWAAAARLPTAGPAGPFWLRPVRRKK